MIVLTRLSGVPFALNCDLVERVEQTPDTIITLVDGKKYIVMESLDDVVAAINNYRSTVLADSVRLGNPAGDQSGGVGTVRHLTAIPGASGHQPAAATQTSQED